jgi:hypothetical protein
VSRAQQPREQETHFEAGEQEYFIREDLNGIAIEVEGDQLAEVPDRLQWDSVSDTRSARAAAAPAAQR